MRAGRILPALVALVSLTACSSGPKPLRTTPRRGDRDGGSCHQGRVHAERSAIADSADQAFAPASAEVLRARPAFSVPAVLKLADERPVFEMPTSTGTIRKMERVGTLEFTIQGQPLSLGAFVPEGTGRCSNCSCRSPT
jgi:hypothetical protein